MLSLKIYSLGGRNLNLHFEVFYYATYQNVSYRGVPHLINQIPLKTVNAKN